MNKFSKRIGEYFRIKINGNELTVIVWRNEKDFDNSEINPGKAAKLWCNFVNNKIKEIFNTEEWEYLGEWEDYKGVDIYKLLMIQCEEIK